MPPNNGWPCAARPRHPTSELFEFFQLLFHGQRREPVLHQQLGECSGGRSFRGTAVVGGQINHQGVVQLAHFLDMVDDPSDMIIDVFQKSGIDLHLP
jgi:Ni,Fe-hydrogenase III large subunit